MNHSFPAAAPDRDLVESLGAIIWEADPITLQFTYVNRAAEKLLGYPVEDWLSRPTLWIDLHSSRTAVHGRRRGSHRKSARRGVSATAPQPGGAGHGNSLKPMKNG
jgi:PAS domain-containing protein